MTEDRPWFTKASVVLVAVVTFVPFFGSLNNDFVNWDEHVYVTQNPLIGNLSWSNTGKIFSSAPMASYVPIVALSREGRGNTLPGMFQAAEIFVGSRLMRR